MGTRTKVINQQNPPSSKKKRVDSKGNDRRRIFAKSGTATLLIAEGLTLNAALAFTEKMQENAEHLGGRCVCDFHIGR